MSGLRLQRTSIRRNFTKALNEFKEELAKGVKSDVVKMLRSRVSDRFNQLEKIDQDILERMREEDLTQEEMDEEFEGIQEYRDKWNDVNSIELMEIENQSDNDDRNEDDQSITSQRNKDERVNYGNNRRENANSNRSVVSYVGSSTLSCQN